MKLIKPSFEILSQEEGLSGIYKMIEVAGRNCYKSENNITEDSSTKFVQMLIDRQHLAMLEHGTVYLSKALDFTKYLDNKYSKVILYKDTSFTRCPIICQSAAITTNYRVIIENDWLDDLQYICEPTEFHEKRYTVKFICDRGISHEFVRHRVFSFAQESTRYCNYSKSKFGSELTFIIPPWTNFSEGTYSHSNATDWEGKNKVSESELEYQNALKNSEYSYFKLISDGWTPQQARSVLPNSLKTELVMTGFVSDWKHFFDLRCSTAAHPQARELAIPLYEYFKGTI